jgi:hypothetical protein
MERPEPPNGRSADGSMTSRHLGAACLFACFLIAGIPMANVLGAHDAEPGGATLFLWLLCVIGAAIGAIFFAASSTRFRRSAGPMIGSVAGVVSAAAYFALLTLVHRGIGIFVSVGLAVSAVVAITGLVARMAPASEPSSS